MSFSVTGFSCSREGLTIRGYVYRPSGEYLPAVIISHGLGTGYQPFEHYARFLAGLGMACVIFDFCGGSNAAISDGSTLDTTVSSWVEDLCAVYAYTAGLSFVDPGRIYLMGGSMGAFASAVAAAGPLCHARGLVLMYPAFCIPKYIRAGRMAGNTYVPGQYPEYLDMQLSRTTRIRIGRAYLEDMGDKDAYELTREYQGRVLILHGTADRMVPMDFSRRARDMYEKSGADVRLEVIPGGGHGFHDHADELALEEIRLFFKKEVDC